MPAARLTSHAFRTNLFEQPWQTFGRSTRPNCGRQPSSGSYWSAGPPCFPLPRIFSCHLPSCRFYLGQYLELRCSLQTGVATSSNYPHTPAGLVTSSGYPHTPAIRVHIDDNMQETGTYELEETNGDSGIRVFTSPGTGNSPRV